MIKVLTAYTYEFDNPQKAVHDILEKLDVQNSLLKHSAAMLFCNAKLIETGVMEEVCKNLPFDVLGCTSMYIALSAGAGSPASASEIILTVTVLTSDDTEFATGISEPLTAENAETSIHALYEKTASSLGGSPVMAFAFLPTRLYLPIDTMTAALDCAGKGTPIFGTVALDMDTRIRNPNTVYNGTAYNDRIALLLLKGAVKPQFSFLRFPERSSLARDTVITSAKGPEIISINNKPAASFLKELGLFHDDASFSHAIPLVIEDSDGNNPEVVIVLEINAEGALICSRHVQTGGILDIGAITIEHILESARTLVQNLKKNEGSAGLFIFSCFLRSIVLGEGPTAEVELIQQELDDFPCPYLFLSSGGELCPKYTESGETMNQALQYAIIACRL
jgi:hypothetical protein